MKTDDLLDPKRAPLIDQRYTTDWRAGGLLPAVVIGKRLEDPDVSITFRRFRTGQRFQIVALQHQFAGVRCENCLLVGAILPLRRNLEKLVTHARSRESVERLFTAFSARAESLSDRRPLLEGAALPRGALTSGRDFIASETSSLSAQLHEHWGLPGVALGAEALVELGAGAVQHFAGWIAVSFSSDGESPQLGDDFRFEVARFLDAKARVFLVWENID